MMFYFVLLAGVGDMFDFVLLAGGRNLEILTGVKSQTESVFNLDVSIL